VAQFGRGVMQDVSAKLMRRFAECLAEEIAAGPAVDAPATPSAEPVASGRSGVLLPPGPAAAAAEAAAREHDAPPRRRPAADVLDLGAVGREAVLRRALPAVLALAVLGAVLAALRRRR
jgi:hypothetical protein